MPFHALSKDLDSHWINWLDTGDLLTAGRPTMQGSGLPMRATLATRLLALNTEVEASHNARATVALKATFLRLFRQPWFCAGAELAHSKQQLAHQFRFTVEILARQGLLTLAGEPQGFTDLVTCGGLQGTEPANFVLGFLLLSNGFHDLLTQRSVGETPPKTQSISKSCGIKCQMKSALSLLTRVLLVQAPGHGFASASFAS